MGRRTNRLMEIPNKYGFEILPRQPFLVAVEPTFSIAAGLPLPMPLGLDAFE